MLRSRTSLISEVRRLVAESKTLLKRALDAVSSNDIELAEKLASEAIKRLDEASKMLSLVESIIVKGGDDGVS